MPTTSPTHVDMSFGDSVAMRQISPIPIHTTLHTDGWNTDSR